MWGLVLCDFADLPFRGRGCGLCFVLGCGLFWVSFLWIGLLLVLVYSAVWGFSFSGLWSFRTLVDFTIFGLCYLWVFHSVGGCLLRLMVCALLVFSNFVLELSVICIWSYLVDGVTDLGFAFVSSILDFVFGMLRFK